MSIRPFWKKIFSLDTTAPRSEALSFLEVEGKVIEPIAPGATGRVQLQGVSWLARCVDTLRYPLPVETPVRVIKRIGLILLIKPVVVPMANTPPPAANICHLTSLSSTRNDMKAA
ncbi:MAG: NfeD family protein [Cyanobacteria bacterium P01_F01_bin.13]